MTAATLEALQVAFQDHLLAAAGDAPMEVQRTMAAALLSRHGISSERRLGIYHHAYRARLIDTLRDTFGHTLAYLGDEWFNTDARAYVEAHPSEHPSLRWYGGSFARWLADGHSADPDIAELAELDWALRRAFDGPDATVLTLADLGAVAPDDWTCIGLRLHPTCDRLRLAHNTLALWQALDQEQAPPPSAALEQPSELLVWRRDLQPHFRSLSAIEAAAIDHLRAGLGFAATCERLGADFPDADIASQAGALLRRWVDEGLLSALVMPA